MKTYKVTVSKYATRWYNEMGKLHREDGPAVEHNDGTKSWWINGQRHREDGPAIEWFDETKSWYINGKQLTEEEFNKRNSIPEYTMEELVAKIGNFKIKK